MTRQLKVVEHCPPGPVFHNFAYESLGHKTRALCVIALTKRCQTKRPALAAIESCLF